MKFLTKKSITQKIIIAVIISILFGFAFPTYSQADVFGVLFDPIFEFVAGIGDSILALLQNYLYNGRTDLTGRTG
ncbi:MAG: hypothetical protein ACI4UU_01535 [Clostridia bacterium]